jgi:hypothetical protein
MPTSCPSGLVGLIVIDASAADDASLRLAAGDETLEQILAWLARGNRRIEFRVPPASRFASTRLAHTRVPLVAADCQSLGAQLERAAIQLRRRIAQRS